MSTTRSGASRRARTSKSTPETTAKQSDAQDVIPGLVNDVVTAHILSSDNLPEMLDLARLRAVSRAIRDAVDATGLEIKELSALKVVELG
jgi:hypothetical protein